MADHDLEEPSKPSWVLSGINRFIGELTNPWDWVGAAAGGAAGFYASAQFGFLDGLHSVGAGALLGASASKSIRATAEHGKEERNLENSAKKLEKTLEDWNATEKQLLLTRLRAKRSIWKTGALPNVAFKKELQGIGEEYAGLEIQTAENDLAQKKKVQEKISADLDAHSEAEERRLGSRHFFGENPR